MAIATGLAESRVNQIIREQAETDQRRKNAAAAERAARHMPDAIPPGARCDMLTNRGDRDVAVDGSQSSTEIETKMFRW